MAKNNFELDETKSGEATAAANILAQLGESPVKEEPAKPSKKKSNSDYMRLDVADYKSYLQAMAAYDSIRSGHKVSITRYVQLLIEADMKARAADYEKAKSL